MIDWPNVLAPALQERLVLLLNHVIGREPAAMARLLPFQQATMVVSVQGTPAWAPALPDLALRITPAGLLERVSEPVPEAQLRVTLDASNPMATAMAAFKGEKPAVSVSGDAALAGAVNWLFENLRFDPADELARAVGPAPAQFVAQAGQGLKDALAALLSRGAR
jgi:ubiquinone biosynthesis protein UbiJ